MILEIAMLLICIINLIVMGFLFYHFKSASNSLDKDDLKQQFDSQKEQFQEYQTQFYQQLKENRSELQQTSLTLQDGLLKRLNEHAQLQKNQLDTFSKQLLGLTKTTDDQLNLVRDTLEKRLQHLQEDNHKKLEQMRVTVDEKLQSTLEKRLGESFKLVSDRLEMVHKGLGEMQHLATGVGDLKKVLSNVKTRGIWGEIHLANLLEQLLTPDQFSSQVRTKKGSHDAVDFAIKLPGKRMDDEPVWLPVDAKFPMETYQHLLQAQEAGDKDAIELATKQLEQRVRLEAKTIQEKYCDPPHTTDFAVMYFPTEGLYAEVLRLVSIHDDLQSNHRVLIAGPTTLAALLNSLQMGFRTLAIEKRSSEVWSLLGAVKSDFGKFGDLLDKTHKKLQEAGNTIDTAARKTRTIERKLRDVEDGGAQIEKQEDFLGQQPLTLDPFSKV